MYFIKIHIVMLCCLGRLELHLLLFFVVIEESHLHWWMHFTLSFMITKFLSRVIQESRKLGFLVSSKRNKEPRGILPFVSKVVNLMFVVKMINFIIKVDIAPPNSSWECLDYYFLIIFFIFDAFVF